MSGILFDEIVFGPVKSRRFGVSLGINLLPLHSKLCSFDCIYCECGLTHHEKGHKPALYNREQILASLENRLQGLVSGHLQPDSITFAGNGEPTLHPDFRGIIEGVVALRDKYFRMAKITVLSNATMLDRTEVREALRLVDNNVLKLDAGTEKMFQAINRPLRPISLNTVVSHLMQFNGALTIQTLFIRGILDGNPIDNTLDPEIEAWLGLLQRIRPINVMIYPIDRRTPYAALEKVSHEELVAIGERVKTIGIPVEVF